jgi:hypothetical protein
MLFLSPMLRRLIYPSLGKIGYFHYRRPATLAVVTYHGVLSPEYRGTYPFLDEPMVGVGAFRRQLQLLKSHYNVISPALFFDWLENRAELPRRAVLLTCDDGLLNNLTEMLPVLQEERLSCLFFVTGAGAGETPAMLWYVELYLLLMKSRIETVSLSTHGIRLDQPLGNDQMRRVLWWGLVKRLSRLNPEERQAFLNEAASKLGIDCG